jgi:hypothetical protein
MSTGANQERKKKAPEPKLVVKFVQKWNQYNAGELAGFETQLAHRLVQGGVATLVGPPTQPRWKAVNDAGSKPAASQQTVTEAIQAKVGGLLKKPSVPSVEKDTL